MDVDVDGDGDGDETFLQASNTGDTQMSDDKPQIPHAQESESADWGTRTFQLFECAFDPTKRDGDSGIAKSFTTDNTFNSTVGESRRRLGIKEDDVKMTNGRENNFFKALKWSPDGTCLLSSSNDNCLRIFELPDPTKSIPENTALSAGVLIKEGEVVYDMCWYPAMDSRDPATCCILSSSRDHPVRLWDAYSGELRGSYTIVDHCEVNLAPTALCFNLDGSKIYCGSNNMIEIFDTARPGRDSQKRPTVPTRKSRKGQKGVISCLSFNPDHSDLYAAGSYLKTIGLYDARADELLLLLRDKGNNAGGRRGEMGGVTQVQFSPDGQYLYSASRQDPWIRCWDIRDTAQVLYRLERPGDLTNQRIAFDISYDGRWLSTGAMSGDISVFDLTNPSDGKVDRLAARIHGHSDVVSAATFHPSGTILATCSGQRKYDLDLDTSDSSDADDGSDTEMETDTTIVSRSASSEESRAAQVDNSIRLWTLPGEYVWYVNGQRWVESTGMDSTGSDANPSSGATVVVVDGAQNESVTESEAKELIPPVAGETDSHDQGT